MRLLPDMDKHFMELFGEVRPESGPAAMFQRVAGGAPIEIDVIIIDQPAEVGLFDQVGGDAHITQIHLRKVQIGTVQEGDTVTRSRDGKVFKLTTPIAEDDQGMIACNAIPVEAPEGDS